MTVTDALTQLRDALPADPDDHGPIGVPSDAVHAVVDLSRIREAILRGSDLEMFIQWKGTVLCADFWCDCGTDGHLDSDFAHFVRCGDCGAVYELGTQVIAKRVHLEDAHIEPKTFTDDDGASE